MVTVQVPFAGSHLFRARDRIATGILSPCNEDLAVRQRSRGVRSAWVLRLPVVKVQLPFAGSCSSALARMPRCQTSCDEDLAVGRRGRRVQLKSDV